PTMLARFLHILQEASSSVEPSAGNGGAQSNDVVHHQPERGPRCATPIAAVHVVRVRPLPRGNGGVQVAAPERCLTQKLEVFSIQRLERVRGSQVCEPLIPVL